MVAAACPARDTWRRTYLSRSRRGQSVMLIDEVSECLVVWAVRYLHGTLSICLPHLLAPILLKSQRGSSALPCLPFASNCVKIPSGLVPLRGSVACLKPWFKFLVTTCWLQYCIPFLLYVCGPCAAVPCAFFSLQLS